MESYHRAVFSCDCVVDYIYIEGIHLYIIVNAKRCIIDVNKTFFFKVLFLRNEFLLINLCDMSIN